MISEQEGWYTDPYARHEARWISGGVPTRLVRDGKVESYDDPPDSPPSQAWTPIEPPPGSATPLDTLRADAAESETMPSLSELDKMESSAAITAQAHPWFIARNWVPSMGPMRPLSSARRSALVVGGVVAGLIVLLASYLGIVLMVAMLTPGPPSWGGVIVGFLLACAAPAGTYWFWRGDRRAGVATRPRLQRTELAGALFGLLVISVVILVAVA